MFRSFELCIIIIIAVVLMGVRQVLIRMDSISLYLSITVSSLDDTREHSRPSYSYSYSYTHKLNPYLRQLAKATVKNNLTSFGTVE